VAGVSGNTPGPLNSGAIGNGAAAAWGYGGAVVPAVLARPLRWVRRTSARVLTGLAALALAAGLGATALTAPAQGGASAVVAAPAPAVTQVARPAGGRAEAAVPRLVRAPGGHPLPGPAVSSDEEPAGGSRPRAAGERAPPAARA
jgi:hypothetical protein